MSQGPASGITGQLISNHALHAKQRQPPVCCCASLSSEAMAVPESRSHSGPRTTRRERKIWLPRREGSAILLALWWGHVSKVIHECAGATMRPNKELKLTKPSIMELRSLTPVLRVLMKATVARVARSGRESPEPGCHGACRGSKGCAACLRSSREDRASDGVTGQRSLSREWRPPRHWSKIVASCTTRQSRGSRHREACRRHSPCRGLQAPRQPPVVLGSRRRWS